MIAEEFLSNKGINAEVRVAIDVQLTLMISIILDRSQSSISIVSEVPTLLTKMLNCKSLTCSTISLINFSPLQFLKSATTYRNLGTLLLCFDKFCPISQILLFIFFSFLEIRTTLHPLEERYYTNPRPIPSVAPVTMAHFSSMAPYFLAQPLGRNYFAVS